MPLLVSIGRETLKLGETLLARHRNNRWIAEAGEEFATLEILGPLVVTPVVSKTPSLGPYQRLSMFDGVGYVDRRVHWPAMRVSFHRTGP